MAIATKEPGQIDLAEAERRFNDAHSHRMGLERLIGRADQLRRDGAPHREILAALAAAADAENQLPAAKVEEADAGEVLARARTAARTRQQDVLRKQRVPVLKEFIAVQRKAQALNRELLALDDAERNLRGGYLPVPYAWQELEETTDLRESRLDVYVRTARAEGYPV